MESTRRVSANVPKDLLEVATRFTGKGITETLIQGLRLILERKDYQETMARLAGSMPDFPSLEEIRAGLPEDLPRESFDVD